MLFLRSAIVFLLLTALLASITTPGAPHSIIIVATWGAICASGARAATFHLAARKGLVLIDDVDAPAHRSLGGTIVAAIIGAVVALPIAFFFRDWIAVALAGLACTVGGVFLGNDARKSRRRPRRVTRRSWIIFDTALPSAVIAAAAALCAGTLRLHALDVVPAGEIARHLGGTSFLYAILVGFGGALKTYSELKGGLVVIMDRVDRPGPGPMIPGALLGVIFLFSAPWLPALPFEVVLGLKAALGFVLGGALSALGALQGAHRATTST